VGVALGSAQPGRARTPQASNGQCRSGDNDIHRSPHSRPPSARRSVPWPVRRLDGSAQAQTLGSGHGNPLKQLELVAHRRTETSLEARFHQRKRLSKTMCVPYDPTQLHAFFRYPNGASKRKNQLHLPIMLLQINQLAWSDPFDVALANQPIGLVRPLRRLPFDASTPLRRCPCLWCVETVC